MSLFNEVDAAVFQLPITSPINLCLFILIRIIVSAGGMVE